MSQDQLAPISILAAGNLAEDSEPHDECDEDILTLWSAEFQDDPGLVEPCPASHLDRLQGAWITISGKRQAELLIAGHHLTIHFGDGDIYMGSFTLGTSGRRMTLDVRVEEGPPRHQGLPVLCICELEGDTLRWCNATPGETVRPTAFDAHNPHLLCLIFRREHCTSVR